MFDYFRSRLRVIEEEFGTSFLERKADHELRPAGKGQHPVRFHWRTAKRFLRGLHPGERNLINPSLAIAVEYANTLELAKQIPGFHAEFVVRDRLKNPVECEAAFYEMRLACLHRAIGNVEFVLREDSRTPDLRVCRDTESVYIECQWKNRVTPAPEPDHFKGRLAVLQDRLLKNEQPTFDVFIMVIGNDYQTILETIQAAESMLADGKSGVVRDSRKGACLIVDCAPVNQAIPERTAGVSFPRGLAMGKATFLTRFNDQGQWEMKGLRRVQIFTFDSHSFNNILNGFNDKRQSKQIPDGQNAMLSFDVDLSRLHPENQWRYLDLVGDLLAERAWRGGENTRIGALCLTGQVVREVQDNGWSFLHVGTLVKSRLNLSHPAPRWIQAWPDHRPSAT